MANTLLTPQIITRKALAILHQKLNFVSKVNRQYDDRFAVSGAKIGTTLNIRKPPRYTVSTGAALAIQDSVDTQVPLTVNTQKHVDISFSSVELTMQVDDFADRYLEPAMAQLAASIENDALAGLYKTVYQQAGSPTAPAASLTPFLSAKKYMTNSLTPAGKKNMILNTDTTVTMVDALKGLFQSSDKIAEQYEDGMLGRTSGFDFYENTLLPVHTTGTYGGTPLVSGGGQTGSSLVTDGWTPTTTTLNVGDVFTINGVYGVHPETRQSLGYLQQFTVTAVTTTDGSGNSTIGISPAIVPSGQFQTVSNSPADNAPITMFSASTSQFGVNLGFHKNAFTFATADLEDVSQYGAWGAREVYDGISLRVARQYAIGSDTVPCRIDVLYGYAALYPQLAARVANQIASS